VQQLVNILIASELLINDRWEKFEGTQLTKRTVKSRRFVKFEISKLPIEQHKQQQNRKQQNNF